jgi:hypothetical protein
MIRELRNDLVDDNTHPVVGLPNEKCMTVGRKGVKTTNVIRELSDKSNLEAVVRQITETKV